MAIQSPHTMETRTGFQNGLIFSKYFMMSIKMVGVLPSFLELCPSEILIDRNSQPISEADEDVTIRARLWHPCECPSEGKNREHVKSKKQLFKKISLFLDPECCDRCQLYRLHSRIDPKNGPHKDGKDNRCEHPR